MSRGILVLAALVIVAAAAAPVFSTEPIETIEQALSEGDYETAYKGAMRVLKKDPDNARALYVAGAAGVMLAGQDGSGDTGDPERYLERALELAPATPGAHYLLGYTSFRRAKDLRSRDKIEKSTEAFAAAAGQFEAELRLHAGYVKALEGLALALAELPEEPERAIRAHEAWIAADPAALSAYPSLAKSLVAVGRFDDAIALLDRLPRTSQELPWTVTFQILAAVVRGEDEESASDAIRSLAERGSEDWYRQALRVLEQLAADAQGTAAEELELFLDSDPPDFAKQAVVDIYVERNPPLDLAAAVRAAREAPPLPDDARPPERIDEAHLRPTYPELARKAGLEARVEMVAIIRRDGTVLILAARSNRPGLGFEEAAATAVAQWRYRPASIDGKPTSAVFNVVVDFTIER